jgi:6-phosphogluconolactonase
MSNIHILSDKKAVQREGAERVAAAAEEAISKRGRFSLVLSGGSTPGGLYELLAASPYRERIDWSKVHLFWGDERYLPLDDEESCYHLADETLISKVSIPSEQIHPFETDLDDPQDAADGYTQTLRDYFGTGQPRFDLVLLGMGPDGHTASLFPEHATLNADRATWVVVERDSPKPPPLRLSLTLPLLNQARTIVFLVTGDDKAESLRKVLQSDDSPRLPSARVRPVDGELVWLVDMAAGAELVDI